MFEAELDKLEARERLDDESKRRQEEDHKFEIFKILQDSKYQMQRRKTLR